MRQEFAYEHSIKEAFNLDETVQYDSDEEELFRSNKR
jgi:hypothetical protein